MSKILRVFLFLNFLAMCGVFFVYPSARAEEKPFELVTPMLDGKTFDSNALHGKVVIVHFWATWCPSCREEMPVLEDFYLHHHAQGVEIIAVSTDRPRARDKVIAYMHDFHFPASLISDATSNSFGTPSVLPITYVIDTSGAVRKTFTPDTTKLTLQLLEGEILPLVSKK